MTRRAPHRARPLGAAALLLAGALLAAAPPALASTPTPTDPARTTSTSAPPATQTTTTTRATTTTTTTPPTTAPPTTATTAPTTTSPPTTATTVAPTTTLAPPPTQPAPKPVDAVDEDGSDTTPGPIPVPPRGAPRLTTPVDAAVARTVGQQVKAAKAASAVVLAQFQAAEKALVAAEQRAAGLQRTYERLYADQARAAERLKAARLTMRSRAVALYVTGPSEPEVPVGKDVHEAGRRNVLIDVIQERDRRNLEAYQGAKETAGDAVNKLVDDLEKANSAVVAARANAEVRAAAAQRSLVGVGLVQQSDAIAVNGFVFPVGDPHNFTDTFGAPRMAGTAYFHTHQGADIFAPYGTPLFACERGVVTKVGTNRLGGTKLWIVGESGTSYYYAHLSAFATGIADGLVVEAGTVVGYVGNSGNAISTPPHLHFEIHPGGGPAVNPTLILKAADDAVKQVRSRDPNAPGLPNVTIVPVQAAGVP